MNIASQPYIAHTNALDKDCRVYLYSDTNNRNIYLHEHDFFEMYILLEGHIQYRTAGSSFFLQPNDVLFVNTHQPHCPALIHPDMPYKRIVFDVSPKVLRQLSTPDFDLCECFMQDNFTVYHYPQEVYRKIMSLIDLLAAVTEDNQPGAALLRRSYLTILFVEINKYNRSPRIYSFNSETTNLQMGAIVRQYIHDHLSETISVEDLANYFFMSKSSFMHAFKKACGDSVYQYVQQQRMEFALQMINNGVPLTTVSQSCGFNDYSNFYRSFKRQFGVSPRELSAKK